jgi:hypothetical protein
MRTSTQMKTTSRVDLTSLLPHREDPVRIHKFVGAKKPEVVDTWVAQEP